MTSYEITCIKKAGSSLPGGLLQRHQGNITHIGYRDERSTIRVISIQQAIQMLKSKQCAFHVKDKLTQGRITVIVVNRNGLLGNTPYLRTIANGSETDNLEQLPVC